MRALPVAFFLEGNLKEFKESLPLLLDLKNEALRDRLKLRNVLSVNVKVKYVRNNVIDCVVM